MQKMKFLGHLYRNPIFKEVCGYQTENRESKEIEDIKPVGIGKGEYREEGLEVLNTKSERYPDRKLNIKISVIADEEIAWMWADTLVKSKKIIKKLFDQFTDAQKQEFSARYRGINKIPQSDLGIAYSICYDNLRKNREEKNKK